MRNRLRQYWGRSATKTPGNDGAALMAKRDSTTPAGALESAPADVVDLAKRTAELVTAEIKRRWKRSDASLARAASIHPSGLSILKTKGVETVTPTLRSVCGIIGIDPDALVDGRVVDVEPSTRRPDLHAMLESVVGTPDEPAVEQVLRAFVKARKH